MNHHSIEDTLKTLSGRRDKHIIANTYNFERKHPNKHRPAIHASKATMRVFRKLGIVEKRPEHRFLPVERADYILSDWGVQIAKTINERYQLALAVPSV